MLKFQTPMSNDEVCRAMTDKHTNTQKTYILSKNWGNLFFTAMFFIFYFYFSNSMNVKKGGFQHTYWVKTEETFFLPPSFLFSIFIYLIVWTLKKAVSNTSWWFFSFRQTLASSATRRKTQTSLARQNPTSTTVNLGLIARSGFIG